MGTSVSAIINATTLGGTPPGAATGLAASSVQSQQFTLTWIAPRTGNTPFTYTAQTRVTGTTTWTSADPVTITTATITGLQANTQYDVQVVASNGYAPASTSATYNVTTSAVSGSWNASAKSASVTLSNTNLTANAGTFATGQNGQGVIGTVGKTTGKWFFEVTAGSITADWAVGIANAAFNLGNSFGSDTNAIAFYPVSPLMSIWFNEGYLSGVSSGTADVSGAIISVAFDVGAQLFWVTSPAMRTAHGGTLVWNNSTTANPATGTGGLSFAGLSGAVYPAWATNEQTGNATVNYGATSFSISVPSSFTALGGANPLSPPAQPTALTVTATTSSTASLSWTEPATGGAATSYTIQAATITSGVPASANDTVVTNSAYTITDSAGNTWGIDGNSKVTFNGTEIVSSGIIGLAYVSGIVWCVNSSAQWYGSSVSGSTASITSGPLSTPGYTSPTNTIITGAGPGFIDSSGNLWGITAGQVVLKNGTADTTTHSVAEMACVSGVAWHENTSGQWYSYTGSGWTGGGTTSPLTGTAVSAPLPTAPPSGIRAWSNQPGTNFCFWNMPLGANCTWGGLTTLIQ